MYLYVNGRGAVGYFAFTREGIAAVKELGAFFEW